MVAAEHRQPSMTGPTFAFGRLAQVASAVTLFAGSAAASAGDGQWQSVPACAAQAARGVHGYEDGVLALGDQQVWGCEVVGLPVAAGTIHLRHVEGGILLDVRHAASDDAVAVFLADDGSVFVEHHAVQVALHLPPPAVGVPGTTVGGKALLHLPAWRVMSAAFADTNLQAAILASAGGTGACLAACDASVAVPRRCVDSQVDEECCLKLAALRRCHAYCACDANSPTPEACRLLADAAWSIESSLCSGLIGEPLEP